MTEAMNAIKTAKDLNLRQGSSWTVFWLCTFCLAFDGTGAYGQTATETGWGWVDDPTQPITVKIDVFIPEMHAVDPNPYYGGVAAGDNRDFSQPGTSRVVQTAVIYPDTMTVVPMPVEVGTTHVREWSGYEASGTATSSGVTTTTELINGSGGQGLKITMAGSIGIPTDPAAPTIDWSAVIYFNKGASHDLSLNLTFNSDGFPAYEIFLNNQSSMRVRAGNSPLNLFPYVGDTTNTLTLSSTNGTMNYPVTSIPPLYLGNIEWTLGVPEGNVTLLPMYYYDLGSGAWVKIESYE
jgi:hypothetical protein